MSVYSGPEIANDGLVFAYDMGNTEKSWKGRPTTNSINAATAGLGRYNNPGFSGTVTNTGQTYKGMPIYELTFIPQDSSFISRLASGEGFGCVHTMGIALQANTRYMASIYVKSDHPLQASASQGFSNGYSNISGWNQNGTTSTRYQEDGWTRLYTQYLNSVDGYSTRTSTFQVNFTVNTTATQTVDVNFTVPTNGSGIVDFATLHAIVGASPNIASNGGLTGLSIVNHGLNTTDFQKLSWPSVVRLKSSDLPFNYFVRLSVPSTGGVNTTISLRANFNGYYTALTDSKYWKLTFDTTGVAVGQVLKTYWCCPMIEQHDTVYPSTFVNGTRTNTQAILDLVGNNTVTANALTYNTDGSFSFNGSNNGMTVPGTNFSLNAMTIGCWCFSTNFQHNGFLFEKTTNGSVNTQYSFFFNNNAGSNLYFRTYGLSSTDLILSRVASGVVDNAWNHVVATFDGSIKRIYVNGNLMATSAALTGTIVQNNTGAAFIGIYGNFAGYPFNGKIDSEKIYNRALTAAEVQQNFSALRGRFGI
jgi:hypothetical protein